MRSNRSVVAWSLPTLLPSTGVMLRDRIPSTAMMTTRTVTQLYDAIATACDDLQSVEAQLEDTNPEAADRINQIVSNLSGHALNAYNATEYSSQMARKERKARTGATGEADQ